MSKAKYGDIIYTKHKLYKHYAIYINDNSVIHYDGKIDDIWLRKMCIRKSTMDRFLDGKNKYYIYNNEAGYSPKDTVNRAKSRIGEKKFNLIWNNCEHFAMWCKIGKNESYQVNLVANLVLLFLLTKPKNRVYT